MFKKLGMILMVFLFLIVVGCQSESSSSENESGKKVSIRLAHGGDPVHPWNSAAEKFAEQVKEESNGEIEVQIFTAGQMGSDREMLESTQSGALEMSVISTMAMSGFEPYLQIFDLPYLFPDYESAYSILDGEIGNKVSEKLVSKGLRNMAYWENDFRQLSNSTKVIDSIDDLNGMKIRVPETPILISWLENLNAVPTPIAYTELYTSLQQGIVEGQDNGIFLSHSAKYYEVQDYYTLTNHIYAPAAFLINESFYQGLTDKHKEIIEKATTDARDYQRQLNADLRDERLQEMKDAGLQVTELSAEALEEFRTSAKEVYEDMKDVIDYDLLQEILAQTK